MKNRNISLVLSSGGARGLAHIGVIETLNKHGFDIKSVSGSSMGALIGGIYAMGKLDVYTNWVSALERSDVIRLLDFSFGRNGLFKGERIIEVLKKLIGDENIEDLPIRFTAVAADLDKEEEVWLNQGPLFEAIRSSIAIPGIFTPYLYQGKKLVDGTLVCPMPIEPTLKDKTDLTIAVNVGGKPDLPVESNRENKSSEKNQSAYHQRIVQFIDNLRNRNNQKTELDIGMIKLIRKSMTIMEHSLTELQLEAYPPDMVIDIPRNICSFHEFYRANEIIDVGRKKAEETLAQYRQKGRFFKRW